MAVAASVGRRLREAGLARGAGGQDHDSDCRQRCAHELRASACVQIQKQTSDEVDKTIAADERLSGEFSLLCATRVHC